jgi:putative ABC transport system permease protein
VSVMPALVVRIGRAGTMSMNVMERTREIGVLRAIGAQDGSIGRMVVVEGLLIGVISYVGGALLSLPISFLLSNVISLAIFNSPASLALTAQGFALWLGVVLLLAVLASLLPAAGPPCHAADDPRGVGVRVNASGDGSVVLPLTCEVWTEANLLEWSDIC